MKFAISALVALLASAPVVSQDRGPVTAIVVRHAERAEALADDPGLTAAGQARANALLDVARKANVTAIITTQLLRTRSTAEPTAKALRITPEVVASTEPRHVEKVAAAIRARTGQTVLVVGHSNTVPAILAALGVKDAVTICEMEYDKVFAVQISASGAASVTRSSYGSPTPMDANCRAPK